jgi:outer membrane protein, multidrug efflux system
MAQLGSLPARAGLLAPFALVVACASLPPSDEAPTPLAIPAGWSEANAAGSVAPAVRADSLAAWWLRFDDPPLAALVESALRSNTNVQGALAVLQQARAQRDVTAAALWPTLGGSALGQRSMAGGESAGTNLQLVLNASWTPDLFGAQRAAVNSSEANIQASAASLGDVQVQIAAEVALNYILLRNAQARAAITAESIASLAETLQLTLWREQAGLVSALDSDQARSAVEQRRALLPTLQTSVVQTQHALAVLTGRVPGALAEPVAPQTADASPAMAVAVPQARDLLALSIPAQTLRQRADVRNAEYKVISSWALVGQAQAKRWPSFDIGGSLGLSGATLGALGNSSAVLGSLLASITLPILDGGALRASVRVQQAALAQAQQTYRAAVLTAVQEVEDALVALRNDRRRLASLRLAANAATRAAELARQRYSSGLIDFQTVLETQRTLFNTQDNVALASADVSSDHVRLFKALGGGWVPTSDPATP